MLRFRNITTLVLLACLFLISSSAFSDTNRQLFPPKLQDGVYPRHYRPVRTVDFEHLRLEIKVWMSEMSIEGVAHYRFRPLHDNVTYVGFDAMEMEINGIGIESSSNISMDWNYADNKLHVNFDQPLPMDIATELTISYQATPTQGMYFTDSEHVAPEDADQLYTLIEPFGGSYWFPCMDYPNDRLHTEMVATVPDDFVTLSNGLLVESTEKNGWRTDHWKQEISHVVYLVSLVVGQFDIVSDEWRGIPVEYYVEKGRAEDARPSFGKTPDMVEFFSDYYGYPYPYEKYAQVAVRYFRAGGMEHTTATTLHEYTVLDEEARIDNDSDWLIAHELAHQWFGDLVTCNNWADLWLNEGFATYSECLWAEASEGKNEFLDHLWGDMKRYIRSSEHYTRAIVTNTFEDPDEMFDSHSYPKAACVLHMLREQIGDSLFRKVLKDYLNKFSPGLVDTDDFMDVIEQTTGRPMDRFFEQWIFKPGHPVLEITHQWHPDTKQLKIEVKQTQKMEKGASPFAFPLEIEICTFSKTFREKIEVTQAEESAFISCEEAPKSVVIDPSLRVLMEVNHEKSVDMLLYDLQHSSNTVVKMKAIQELSTDTSDRVLDAIVRALHHESFWRVQEEAAALGKIHTSRARKALLDAAEHPKPRVRRAVVSALGKYYMDNDIFDVLSQRFKYDVSIRVAAEAARSLAQINAEDAYKVLRSGLKRESSHDTIRRAVLNALVDLKESKVYSVLVKYSKDPYHRDTRTTAIRGLGELVYEIERHEEDTLKLLIGYLDSPAESIRRAAISGLRALHDEDAIPNLKRVANDDSVKSIRNQADSAIKEIRKDRGSELAAENAKKVEELEITIKKLEEHLQELDKKLDDLSKLEEIQD